MPDPAIGYRLRPNARTRFVTAEFDTEIAINAQGVRDDADIGPKPANERRIVVLGDSLVHVGAGRARSRRSASCSRTRLNRERRRRSITA